MSKIQPNIETLSRNLKIIFGLLQKFENIPKLNRTLLRWKIPISPLSDLERLSKHYKHVSKK